jgi:hypothetical protein
VPLCQNSDRESGSKATRGFDPVREAPCIVVCGKCGLDRNPFIAPEAQSSDGSDRPPRKPFKEIYEQFLLFQLVCGASPNLPTQYLTETSGSFVDVCRNPVTVAPSRYLEEAGCFNGDKYRRYGRQYQNIESVIMPY